MMLRKKLMKKNTPYSIFTRLSFVYFVRLLVFVCFVRVFIFVCFLCPFILVPLCVRSFLVSFHWHSMVTTNDKMCDVDRFEIFLEVEF